MASVLIVDDHDLFALSLSTLLERHGLTVDATHPSSLEGLLSSVDESTPDVVLLDLHLGDEVGLSLPAVRPLHERGIKVLVVSATRDLVEIGACLEAGASGFLSKSCAVDELLGAVRRLLDGEAAIEADQMGLYLDELRVYRNRRTAIERPFRNLSKREQHVLRLLCEGLSVQVISSREHVSVATVRTQVKAILQKLDVGSQLEAVAAAHRSGWYQANLPRRTG